MSPAGSTRQQNPRPPASLNDFCSCRPCNRQAADFSDLCQRCDDNGCTSEKVGCHC